MSNPPSSSTQGAPSCTLGALVSRERVGRCYEIVREALLAERTPAGHWEGELSTSALSTATAVMALEMIRRDRERKALFAGATVEQAGAKGADLVPLIAGGLDWLAAHQNPDGGWGDTTKSVSNISTTMLCRASFHATGGDERFIGTVSEAAAYIDRVGGVRAVRERYGKDRTFSVPILTQCALAGLVEWRDVTPLPFELACLPARFYKSVRLPVVSYALPALIAIGQVRFHHRKPWFPLTWLIRKLSVGPSLRRLEHIQPSSGGFLEAAPLTSFVTMSLAAMGRSEHPVAQLGLEFLVKSVRVDGSWPIDTNLATWVTTLSINALGEGLPAEDRPFLREWLRKQQYAAVHPYTNADPGGWAWTDLPGGVPDADDTPGAVLALLSLGSTGGNGQIWESDRQSLSSAVGWLLDLQNGDGGWPTFCRGWGTLPFDRSAADISAHVLRALHVWRNHPTGAEVNHDLRNRAAAAIETGFRYLTSRQRADGSWLPLWFGNQHNRDDENPTYGTAKVLAAWRDCGRMTDAAARRGVEWLLASQNDDGGWGGGGGTASTVEESALAVEILLSAVPENEATRHGLGWLLDRVEDGTFRDPSPIGFYFAKLWYFERLYPLVFINGALRAAANGVVRSQAAELSR